MERVSLSGIANFGVVDSLKILSKALKDYKGTGEDFEKDYDCKIIYRDGYISGISCNNEASKTMMKLKYD